MEEQAHSDNGSEMVYPPVKSVYCMYKIQLQHGHCNSHIDPVTAMR